jgi:hypothetical protein
MRGFVVNRWTCVLALCIAPALAALPTSAVADENPISWLEDPHGDGGAASGDPDIPGGGKGFGRGLSRGAMGRYQFVGDGLSSGSAWMWRLHVAANTLKIYWLRF